MMGTCPLGMNWRYPFPLPHFPLAHENIGIQCFLAPQAVSGLEAGANGLPRLYNGIKFERL